MEEFSIIPVKREHLYEISGMFPTNVLAALWKGLPVTALAVLKGNTVVGALSGAANGGYFDISSIYVAEAYRRQGAATALMRRLFAFLDEENLLVRVMYGTRRTQNGIPGEADELESFLISLAFEKNEVMEPPYIAELLRNFVQETDEPGKDDAGIFSFSQVDMALLEELTENAVEDEADPGSGKTGWNLLSDTVDKDRSLCKVENDRIVSYVAVDTAIPEPIEISAVWLSREEADDVKRMILSVISDLKKAYHPDTEIILLAMGVGAWEVTRAVCPGAEQASVCYVRPDYGEL